MIRTEVSEEETMPYAAFSLLSTGGAWKILSEAADQ